MGNEVSKVRLKIGQLEVEFEGDPSFLPDGLLNLIEKATTILEEHGAKIPALDERHEAGNGREASGPTTDLDHSTNTIASILGAKTGPDLIIAAAAHLVLVKKEERFTRQGLLKEMQSATSFYKTTYMNNLGSYLKTLMGKDRLRLVANDTYSLPAAVRTELEGKLAE